MQVSQCELMEARKKFGHTVRKVNKHVHFEPQRWPQVISPEYLHSGFPRSLHVCMSLDPFLLHGGSWKTATLAMNSWNKETQKKHTSKWTYSIHKACAVFSGLFCSWILTIVINYDKLHFFNFTQTLLGLALEHGGKLLVHDWNKYEGDKTKSQDVDAVKTSPGGFTFGQKLLR